MRLTGLTRWALAVTLPSLCCSALARADTPPASFVYWTYFAQPMSGTLYAPDIARAGMDGSNPDLTYLGTTTTGGAAIAVTGSAIYWINDCSPTCTNHGGVSSESLDGTHANPSFVTLPSETTTINDLAIQGAYLYFTWSDPTTETSGVGRAALDGGSVDASFITLPPNNVGADLVATDSSYLFFSDGSAGSPGWIGRANIDGTNVLPDFIQSDAEPGAIDPAGLAADNSSVYWGTYLGAGESAIGRSTVAGTNIDYSFIPVVGGIRHIAVYEGYVFWTEHSSTTMGVDTSTIGSAESNGTNIDNDLLDTYSPQWIAVPATSLIVNSTATSSNASQAAAGTCNATPTAPTQTCTLPQAILISNASGGQPISFDIPSGSSNTFDGSVPQIRDTTGTSVPAITAPTTIDGTTQPGAGKVALSGPASSTTGFTVATGGAGSKIKGMVVNGYAHMLVLDGGGDTIQGNLLGTDTSGMTGDPTPLDLGAASHDFNEHEGILVNSSGNQIGGPGAGQGNVIACFHATNSVGLGLIDETGAPAGASNVIQGNAIGLAPGGTTPLLGPSNGLNGYVFALLLDGADTVGGSASGAGNVLLGGEISGKGTVVQGNTLIAAGLSGRRAGHDRRRDERPGDRAREQLHRHRPRSRPQCRRDGRAGQQHPRHRRRRDRGHGRRGDDRGH